MNQIEINLSSSDQKQRAEPHFGLSCLPPPLHPSRVGRAHRWLRSWPEDPSLSSLDHLRFLCPHPTPPDSPKLLRQMELLHGHKSSITTTLPASVQTTSPASIAHPVGNREFSRRKISSVQSREPLISLSALLKAAILGRIVASRGQFPVPLPYWTRN